MDIPNIRRTGLPWPYDKVGSMQLAGGDQGTRQTLAAMAELVRDGARRPDVRSVASGLRVSSGSPRIAFAGRLFAYLKQRVRFEADPEGQELIRHPSQLLAEIAKTGEARGDCDDRAILGAAIARAAGLPTAFVVIGRDPWASMEHVYFAVRIGRHWMPLDPQETDAPGQEVPHARRWVYPIV